MEYTNSYSYFLMDKAFENMTSLFTINEYVDYEWDLKNNTEIDHRNNTIKWLKKSLENTTNKQKWYKRFLSKLPNVNLKVKKSLLITIIPIIVGLIGTTATSEITDAEFGHNTIESNIVSNIINKMPDTKKIKKELSDKYKEKMDKEEVTLSKTFDDFAKDIAHRESSGRWKVSNRYGYMGLYQIGRLALKDVSQRTNDPELKGLHKVINKKAFDQNPHIFPKDLQTRVFKELLKNNKHYLRDYYSYVGKTVGGIEITESGMLASAHLVGQKGIKKFLRSDGKIDVTDGNGVKCSEYLRNFSNYNIGLD